MSQEIELNDIIEDFNNDKRSSSSYSISTEESSIITDSDKIKVTMLSNRKDEDTLFYNNENSQSECNEEDSSEIDSKILEKSCFTSSELSDKKDDIIKLFYMFDVIILTDDFRIKLVSKTGWTCWYKSKKYINPEEFPGILFFSFNSINLIKKYIRKHNHDLLNNDSETCHKFKYQICFDEGDIYKNIVYKKFKFKINYYLFQ